MLRACRNIVREPFRSGWVYDLSITNLFPAGIPGIPDSVAPAIIAARAAAAALNAKLKKSDDSPKEDATKGFRMHYKL